jgi:hypothetical protein
MYKFQPIRTPRSIGLPVQLSEDTQPEYQGITGSGWFMACQVVFTYIENTCTEDIRFMLG